jgi:hypothetical protein
MSIFNRTRNLLDGVRRCTTRTETRTAHKYGIGTVIYGSNRSLKIFGRRKQFYWAFYHIANLFSANLLKNMQKTAIPSSFSTYVSL